MPIFSFRAKSYAGEIKTGALEAKNEKELARILQKEGYLLIEAELAEKTKSPISHFKISLPFFGVSFADKMMFTKNLEVMVKAGVSLPRAISILGEQVKNSTFKKALNEISQRLLKGESFAEALKEYPAIFSEIYYQMIKIGEESGTLENSLQNLALQLEKDYDLRAKIKGALLYPAVIVSFMILVGISMVVYVVPKLAQVFKDLNVELPATTKFLINFSEFLASKFYLAILALGLLFFFFKIFSKTKEGQKVNSFILLKIPVVNNLIQKVNASYVLRTLSTLIGAGVSFVRSVEIVADLVPNYYFKEALRNAQKDIRQGKKLSQALKNYSQIFPLTVLQMLEVGEETGETAKIFKDLAEFYEEEVTTATKNLVSIIEPVLMVIIGLMVGFFAISMIQPIYSMLGSIK
jgi:type IV pilus assembly protein PilC